jgi:hypothetical protein
VIRIEKHTTAAKRAIGSSQKQSSYPKRIWLARENHLAARKAAGTIAEKYPTVNRKIDSVLKTEQDVVNLASPSGLQCTLTTDFRLFECDVR